VHDSSGSAIPGAEIRATQTATGLARTAVAGADGGYVLNLPLGPYMLEISKEGFTKYVQSGIVLQVDSNPTVDAMFPATADSIEVIAGLQISDTYSTCRR
jgi:hypothetical protein